MYFLCSPTIQHFLKQDFAYKDQDKCIVSSIEGDAIFKSFMLSNGISEGTEIQINFSPQYARLINITVGTKMLVFKMEDFQKLHLQKIEDQ